MTDKRNYRKFVYLLSLLLICTLAKAQTFPYPVIPQTLQTPQERGTYLLTHYWDNFNFSDTTFIHKPELTEQGFVNFIDLLPRFSVTTAEESVAMFSQKAFSTTVPQNVRSHFVSLIDHYLLDPNSPLRSDELSIIFLQRMMDAESFSDTERERFAYQLQNTSKNLPGTTAADFNYTTREGKVSSLLKTEGETLLLIFYDPTCAHCTETLNGLRRDAQIGQLIQEHRLAVLAIYTEGDRSLWHQTKSEMPTEWTVGIDESGIDEHAIYSIPAMPVLYLLDKDKRVLLKDPTPQALTDYLTNNL